MMDEDVISACAWLVEPMWEKPSIYPCDENAQKEDEQMRRPSPGLMVRDTEIVVTRIGQDRAMGEVWAQGFDEEGNLHEVRPAETDGPLAVLAEVLSQNDHVEIQISYHERGQASGIEGEYNKPRDVVIVTQEIDGELKRDVIVDDDDYSRKMKGDSYIREGYNPAPIGKRPKPPPAPLKSNRSECDLDAE